MRLAICVLLLFQTALYQNENASNLNTQSETKSKVSYVQGAFDNEHVDNITNHNDNQDQDILLHQDDEVSSKLSAKYQKQNNGIDVLFYIETTHNNITPIWYFTLTIPPPALWRESVVYDLTLVPS